MAIFGGLNYLAFIWSRHGIEDVNPYTINHYKFNSNVCQVLWKICLYVWLLLNTRRPQLRLRTCCCMNYLVWFILGCIRSCAFAFMVYDVAYRIGYVFYLAWALNWLNYWQSVEEPFKTNASFFNAGLCWYLSIPIMIYSIPIAVYLLICCVMIPVCFCNGKFTFKGHILWPIAGIFKFVLLITWDIVWEDLTNILGSRVVRNDSK